MGRLGHDGFNSLGAQKGSLVQAKGAEFLRFTS